MRMSKSKAKATEPADDTELGEVFTKELDCAVEDNERESYKERVLDIVGELLDVEAQKAAKMSEFNKELKDLARTGMERRDVECAERYDYRRGAVETIRLDTKEVIDERAMTADERKTKMPVGDEDEDDMPPSNVTRFPPGSSVPDAQPEA
jgi:hypothetical protein